MRWRTREHIHFDRAISAWLIKRFVDPNAEFVFADEGGDDATPFGLPGVALSSHDEGGSTFHKILRKYELTDPGLLVMNDMVTLALAYLFDRSEPDIHAFPGEVVSGLLAIVEGVVLSSVDDDEALDKSLMLYDAVYALVQARALSKNFDEPASIAMMGMGMWRTAFCVSLASDVRSKGEKLGPHAQPSPSPALASALQRLRDR